MVSPHSVCFPPVLSLVGTLVTNFHWEPQALAISALFTNLPSTLVFLSPAELMLLLCKYPYRVHSCYPTPTWTARYRYAARRQHGRRIKSGRGARNVDKYIPAPLVCCKVCPARSDRVKKKCHAITKKRNGAATAK